MCIRAAARKKQYSTRIYFTKLVKGKKKTDSPAVVPGKI